VVTLGKLDVLAVISRMSSISNDGHSPTPFPCLNTFLCCPEKSILGLCLLSNTKALKKHFSLSRGSRCGDVGQRRIRDKDVLDILHSQPPEYTHRPSGEVPYILAFDIDAPGENSDNPGSMKVELGNLMYLYEEGLEKESMRGLRLRSSEWFRSDDIDLEHTYEDKLKNK
jgi:hypothetical protein